MADLYNLTNITSSYDPLSLFTGLNTLSEGYFGLTIIIILWIILFIGFKTYNSETAMLNATWIIAILSVLLFTADMITITVLVPVIVLTGILAFIKFMSDN